jgi:hypothetical protein
LIAKVIFSSMVDSLLAFFGGGGTGNIDKKK